MEKVKVTFAGENRTITMDFTHNEENQSLDYNVTVDPELKEGENDLTILFANVFLDALNRPATPDVAFVPEDGQSEETPAV